MQNSPDETNSATLPAPRATLASRDTVVFETPSGWLSSIECAAVLTVSLLLALIFQYRVGGEDFVVAVGGASQLLAALMATGACLVALRRIDLAQSSETHLDAIAHDAVARPKRSDWRDLWPWRLVALSLMCFAVACALTLNDANQTVPRFVSYQDPLRSGGAGMWWLLQYPILWLGLLLMTWPDGIQWRHHSPDSSSRLSRLIIDRLIVVLAVLVVFWKMLLEQRFATMGIEGSLVQRSLVLFYPLAVVGHLFCALMLMAASRRRLGSRTLGFLLGALLLLILTDSVYAYQVAQDVYRTGAVVDAGWIAAWLLFGVGALDHSDHVAMRVRQKLRRRETLVLSPRELAQSASDATKEAANRWSEWRRGASIWLPYSAALVACAVLAFNEIWNRATSFEWAESGALERVVPILGLVMAVIARQMMTLADNLRLSARLRSVNVDLERNVKERTRHLSTLHSIMSTLNSSLDDRAILGSILEGVMPAIGADGGGIWLRAVATTTQVSATQNRIIHNQPDKPAQVLAADSRDIRLDWAVERVQGLDDDDELAQALRDRAILAAMGARNITLTNPAQEQLPDDKSLILLPIRWQGLLLGTLAFMRREGKFSAQDRALVKSVALEAGTALQNARLYQEASRRADRDSVTELFNHRAIQQQLYASLLKARGDKQPFAVVMMDLNNFKFFNDAYGHLVGDDVLRAVSHALNAACRTSDIVGRYGGDEFIAILPATNAQGAREVCARIAEEMDQRHFEAAPDSHIPIAMSFGWAIYPDDGETPLELTTRADANLYENKRTGGLSLLQLTPPQSTHTGTRRSKDRALGSSFGVLDALVTAIDNKDHYTRRHSEEVTHLALLTAEELGYSIEMQRAVRIAGLLHDVGKIAVPDSILRHPGRLGSDETQIMRQHPVFGALIVRDVAHQDAVVAGVRHHHERYDGQGYPDGLHGEDIPWMGRLLAVADVYSAFTTDRPYRKALSPEAALYEIEAGARTHFDPVFCTAFVHVMRRELHRVSHQQQHPHPNQPLGQSRPNLRLASALPPPSADESDESLRRALGLS